MVGPDEKLTALLSEKIQRGQDRFNQIAGLWFMHAIVARQFR